MPVPSAETVRARSFCDRGLVMPDAAELLREGAALVPETPLPPPAEDGRWPALLLLDLTLPIPCPMCALCCAGTFAPSGCDAEAVADRF